MIEQRSGGRSGGGIFYDRWNADPGGCKGWFTRSDFRIRFILKFKEVADANQHFHELKQCQRIIGSENRVNQP